MIQRQVPLRALFRRRNEANQPELQMLSVYRDLGVIPRSHRDDNFNRPGEDLNAYKVVYPNDLVLNKMKTWQGSLGISNHHGIVSPAYFVAEPITNNISRFLHYLLRSNHLVAKYAARSKGIRPAQWDLSWNEFAAIYVRLPPAIDQSRISGFLDVETARIDALISNKKTLARSLEERSAVTIESMILNAATSVAPLRRLLSRPPQYGAVASGQDFNRGWPRYIRITDLSDKGSLRQDDARYLDPRLAGPFILDDGDILIARSGATVGKTFLYHSDFGPACFAGYLIRLQLRQDILKPSLFTAWTQTRHYWDQVRTAGSQSTIENVNANQFKSFEVPVLPKAVQETLSLEIERINERTRLVVERLSTQVDLLREHRQALITAAVTGELEIPGVRE